MRDSPSVISFNMWSRDGGLNQAAPEGCRSGFSGALRGVAETGHLCHGVCIRSASLSSSGWASRSETWCGVKKAFFNPDTDIQLGKTGCQLG
ncbi:hypothetical protein AAFF_G00387560 [Aldrovandia affinis]|uniref:Uncharacterized protein n=1 Tax=Aldrovandia affinis TaxID=143900 RepID=A0AAD7WM71_9TELE|nr:hypothetical protein AAFF_G00387560 [Aldrovandia affinis]